jgi:hypothetical protein
MSHSSFLPGLSLLIPNQSLLTVDLLFVHEGDQKQRIQILRRLQPHSAKYALGEHALLSERGIGVDSNGTLFKRTKFGDGEDRDRELGESACSCNGGTSRRKPQLGLTKLWFGLNADFSLPAMIERRDAFKQILCGLKALVSTNKQAAKDNSFTPQKLDDLTNFWGDGTMGAGAIKHLKHMCEDNAASIKDEADKDPLVNAANLAASRDIPRALRNIFAAISRRQPVRRNINSALDKLFQNVLGIEVLALMDKLEYLARTGNKKFRRFLKRIGETTARGKRWKACVKNYLAKQLILGHSIFSNIMQEGQLLRDLVTEFG